jgi:hypothetical protein
MNQGVSNKITKIDALVNVITVSYTVAVYQSVSIDQTVAVNQAVDLEKAIAIDYSICQTICESFSIIIGIAIC